MKAETIIGLVVLMVIGVVAGILYSIYSPEKSLIAGSSPEEIKKIQASNFTRLVSMRQNVCEGCHLSGKKFIPQAYDVKPHMGGGAYCLICHKIDHNIHPIDKNVTCERCHGFATPQIPVFHNGTISCAECHDFPDALRPSNGNLVVIHRPRDVDCIKCHIDSSESCLKCHNEIKGDKKWEKRLAHFNTIIKTAR